MRGKRFVSQPAAIHLITRRVSVAVDWSKIRQTFIYTAEAPLAIILSDLDEISALKQADRVELLRLSLKAQEEYKRRSIATNAEKERRAKRIKVFARIYFGTLILTTLTVFALGWVNINSFKAILSDLDTARLIGFLIFAGVLLGWVQIIRLFAPEKIILATSLPKIDSSLEQAINIPDHRYQLLAKILQTLQPDIKPDFKLKAVLMLDWQIKRRLYRKVSYSRWHDGITQDYQDFWLQLQGKLLDGTRFFITVTQHYQERTGSKRQSSGRGYKSKEKSMSKGFFVKLILISSKNRYRTLSSYQTLLENFIKLPPSVVLRQLKVTDQKLQIKICIPPDAFSHSAANQLRSLTWRSESLKQTDSEITKKLHYTIVMMFLSAYQTLNLVHAQSRT
jgi:hypothetical protein